MIQYIKIKRIIPLLLLLLCTNCKGVANKTENVISPQSNNIEVKKSNLNAIVFYKTFSFCDSNIQMFTLKEAEELYKNITFLIVDSNTILINVSSI